MTDQADLCPGCFLERRPAEACQRCGYRDDPGAFPSALQPGSILSKYVLGKVLGKPGGFGITYLAFDQVLQRRVAIKELMPRELVTRKPDGATVHVHTRDDGETFKYTLQSFLKEARLLAQFSHPNVVRVLDYFEANETAYFAMEYYEGQTLGEYTRRSGGRLPGPEAVSLMLPLLDALDHIHSLPEPILHRDIKPANIYLTGRQTPILLDFGAARVSMGHQTRSLSAVLTPGFAPYEQYASRGKQGPWTDVYACAATLYFVLTGAMPPEANDRVEDRRLTPPRSLVPDIAPHLSDAIVHGLAFMPEERPQGARAFADLISGRQTALPPTERVPSPAAAYAPTIVSGAGDLPRTIVEPSSHSMGRTEIAPSISGTQPRLASPAVTPSVPPIPTPTQTRRSVNRMPIIAAAAAVLLIVAAVWGSGLIETGSTDESAGSGGQVPIDKPTEPEPKTETTGGTRGQIPGGENNVPRIDPAPPGPAPPQEKEEPPAKTPPPPPIQTTPAPPPPVTKPATPPAPAAPATGVFVVIRGDDANGVQQAETAILRSIVGRNGLRPVDADSLSILRGDRAVAAAASGGDIGALAAMGKPHGVEVIVVGELRSRAMPSLNRFFTGTAELSLRMYRVSTSEMLGAETFIVGQGGGQPVMAVSEAEARTRAATQAADAASRGVGIWLGRAF